MRGGAPIHGSGAHFLRQRLPPECGYARRLSFMSLPLVHDNVQPRSSIAVQNGSVAKIALQGIVPEELVQRIPELTLEEARRVTATVHNGGDYTAPRSGVRRASRHAVCAACYLPELHVQRTVSSSVDPFVKLAFRTDDERVVEAVRIPLQQPGRFTVCVSSQVGCALACAFCATGRLGLGRNLEVWEIVEQVRLVKATLGAGQRIHGVVFQGMGEPLANWERVRAAIRVMSHPCGLSIDARNITVSTAGLPNGIRRLANESPKVRLAWSIGSARPEVRSKLMPINDAHALEDVFQAVVEHARTTNISPLWAITLLEGQNDSEADALALAALVRRFRAETGHSPRVSVIPYNAIDDEDNDPFRRVGDAAEARFRDVMRAEGVFTHKRYSGGSDVGAACGQLAAKA
jgi:23S rRNA (adenine2503-C2)-methyltransferase